MIVKSTDIVHLSSKEWVETSILLIIDYTIMVPKLQRMFPKSHHNHDMKKRESEAFQVKRGLTERLRRSAIPHMQRLLNEHERKKRNSHR